MSLITKKVKIKWHVHTKEYYIKKGYFFTELNDEFEVQVEDLTLNSNIIIEMKCDGEKCKESSARFMRYSTYNRGVGLNGLYFCRQCNRKDMAETLNRTILKKSKSFEQWCYDTLPKKEADEIMLRWDTEKNGCSPKNVPFRSNKNYWFKCLKHSTHNSELKNINRVITNFNKNKKTCSLNCIQCNSFSQYLVDEYGDKSLEKYWDYEKNEGINPWELPKATNQKHIWIKCQEKDYHGSYKTTPLAFFKGNKCSYCDARSGKIHPKDSFGQYIVDNYGEDFLNKIWSDKNKKSAFEYAFLSNKKVWWKCESGKHNPYQRMISDSFRYNFRCSKCTLEKSESLLQEKIRLYLQSLNYTILHERDCRITPKNPKTNRYLPFDNDVVELNLIIEVNGIQHYTQNGWIISVANKKGVSSKQELHYQKVKDRYKRMYAKSKGYNYLEIPYWTDDKEETWKELINNKIKEINLKSVKV